MNRYEGEIDELTDKKIDIMGIIKLVRIQNAQKCV